MISKVDYMEVNEFPRKSLSTEYWEKSIPSLERHSGIFLSNFLRGKKNVRNLIYLGL